MPLAFTFDSDPVEYSEDSSAMSILHTLEKYGSMQHFFMSGSR